MLAKTHIVTGIASALIITRPTTVPGLMTAVTGGAVGGWVVDIDCKNVDFDREELHEKAANVLSLAAFIFIDFFFGDNMCHYVASHWQAEGRWALIGFILLMIIGYNTKHRSFTHSFVGMALFGSAVRYFCQPALQAFLCGYGAHIALDLLNKTGMELFFPAKKRFCLNLFYSNKTANKWFFRLGILIDAMLGVYLLTLALT